MAIDSSYFAASNEDFWRTLTGARPDGATDTTDAIRRLGHTGIGGVAVSDAMPVVNTPSEPNFYLHLANSAAGRGQLMYGSSPLSYYTERAAAVAANSFVDIGSFGVSAGAHSFRLSVEVSVTSYSVAKIYVATVKYNQTANVWQVLKPLSDSGAYGANNFEVLFRVSNATCSLRLRRTGGANVGIYNIRLEHVGVPDTLLTESTTSGVDAAAYVTFDPFGLSGWLLAGNMGTTPSAYNDTAAQLNNFLGTLDNQSLQLYTNAGHATNKSDLRLYSATPTGAAVTVPADIFHIRRNGTDGVNSPQMLSIALGKWLADANARTRADFRLTNAAVEATDRVALSLFSQGGAGINGLGANADWVWANAGGWGRGNGGALLALMGANASNNIGPHIGAWTAADTYPLFYMLNWSHNNINMVFDGYYDGNWRHSHAGGRVFRMTKAASSLAISGTNALSAAGTVAALSNICLFQYAGATTAGGEVSLGTVQKNRRLVLHDTDAASDHNFYGFGVNAGILRYQAAAGADHVWYVANNPAASTELMRLMDNGAVGIGTAAPAAGMGRISVANNGYKPGGGAWAAFSDKRIKKEVKPFVPGLKEILALNPVSFSYNGKANSIDNGETYIGLIAQEVSAVLPDFIEEHKIDEETYAAMEKKDQKLFADKTVLALREGLTNFEAVLINAIKELAEENKRLSSRLSALEAKDYGA